MKTAVVILGIAAIIDTIFWIKDSLQELADLWSKEASHAL